MTWFGKLQVITRGAGDSVEPGVERSGTPGPGEIALTKPVERAAAVATECFHFQGISAVIDWGIKQLSPVSTGSGWVHIGYPGVSLRYTPGFTLSPAPRVKIHNFIGRSVSL